MLSFWGAKYCYEIKDHRETESVPSLLSVYPHGGLAPSLQPCLLWPTTYFYCLLIRLSCRYSDCVECRLGDRRGGRAEGLQGPQDGRGDHIRQSRRTSGMNC